ncbi:hypothetical protein SLA2020_104820 [Shorea laevis]
MADRSSKAVVAYGAFAGFVTSAQNYGGKQNGITPNYVGAKGKQSNSYERTARATCVDKHTGAYAHSAAKEVMSTGDIFKERSTGRVGIKNEYTNRKVCRVGDKHGYAEYQVEEKFRRVDYVGSSSHKGNSGSKGSNSIKASSSSHGKNHIKDSSSNRHSSNTKGSSSIKVSANSKGSSSIKVNASIKASSSNKASASIKRVSYH